MRQIFLFGNLSNLVDEPISLRWNRLDKYPVVPIIAKRTSQDQDRTRQVIFFYERVAPHRLQQEVLLNQMAGSAQQQKKHLQRLWFKCDPFPILVKAEIFL